MKYLRLKIIFALLYCSASTAQNFYTKPIPYNSDSVEIPEVRPNDLVIRHTAYTLSYNETYEQANWVAYELTKNETQAVVKRSNKFITDPLIAGGTATNNDYKGSGYDKGHLAPAADMAWSATTMKESFYFSNIAPQSPALNRGIWNNLEDLVRTWAKEYEAIYIVTGPVLRDNLNTIGSNQVAIPEYFYKVILDYSKPEYKAIGFIIPNQATTEPLQHFTVSVDSIEKVTGINFFPALPDDIEELLESQHHIQQWIWRKQVPTN